MVLNKKLLTKRLTAGQGVEGEEQGIKSVMNTLSEVDQ